MPCIKVKTSAAVTADKENEIKSKLGKAIQIFPGKSESWLMVVIEGDCHMYFRGDSSEDMALVEVSLFGALNDKSSAQMTAEITDIIHDSLSIEPDHIYIKYEAVECWGWNGANF